MTQHRTVQAAAVASELCCGAPSRSGRRPPRAPHRSPPVSSRLLRVALPLLAALTTAFGLYQLFLAGLSLRVHSFAFALLYTVMGIGGLALSSSLWRARKR